MRTLKGLAALLALTALVVGIPAALILLVGNPIPSTAELQQALTGIDFGGTFLMGTVLPLIAWGFWASFVYSLVVEVISLIRRVETPNLGGALRPQQALAGALIAAVLALGGGSPAFALTPQDTASAPAAVAMAQEGQTTQDTTQDTPAAAGERTYTVQEGDTLWGIARDELGQGSRWGELAEQMRSTPQADGQTLADPDLIMTGWTVELPDDVADERIAFARGLPTTMRSSMLQDLEAGKRLELDWLTGAVVRLGEEAGVGTPVSRECYEALAPFRGGAAGGC